MDEKKKIKVPLSLVIVFFVIIVILLVIIVNCIKIINDSNESRIDFNTKKIISLWSRRIS